MEKSNVTVKNPCHLKWNDLTKIENSKDRHCNECSWLIKDFRNMTNQEILDYLTEKKGEKVCCAMRIDENKTKPNKIQRTIIGWKTRVKSGLKDNHLKTFLLFFIGIIMLTIGCENEDDVVIGVVPLPEEESAIFENISTEKTLDKTSDNNGL